MQTDSARPRPSDSRLGYVLKVFPRVSETFVINEIRAMEALGEDLVIFSLHRNPDEVPHGILRELTSPLLCIDDIAVDDDELRIARRRLARQLGLAGQLEATVLPRKYVSLALRLAQSCAARGVGRLHAHFASRAGHVGLLAGQLANIPCSITAHAKDIYHDDVDTELLRWKIARSALFVTVTNYNRSYLRELIANSGSGLASGAGVRSLEAGDVEDRWPSKAATVGSARLTSGLREGGAGQPEQQTSVRLASRGSQHPEDKICRVYNGVDLARFKPRHRWPAEPVVLAVGRLVEKKGFVLLVRACAALRDRGRMVKCRIIGEGPQRAAIKSLIEQLGLEDRVALSGTLTTEEVAGAIASSSLLALPCIRAADGNLDALPTVLLEAMASGVPVVSTRISGIPEIVIDGETGLLVDSGDIDALAAAIEKILDDPVEAMRMGRNGRARVEQLFDLYRNAARLRDLIRGGDSAKAA